MADKKESEECQSEEVPSQAESFEGNKSGTSETYDMKDFCPGIRIEAKDFDGKWYPAKVSDVDWTENEILVHFENRNTKFNEWIPMDSSRLRPIQKPTVQQKDIVHFTKGEEVMAVWSSNQKYPAVVQAVLSNDRYDVLFSDGFLKRLKSHKIFKLQGDSFKGDIKNFTDIGTKEERRERKRKINVAELFHVNKRPRKKGLVHSKSSDIKTYPVSKSQSKGSILKKLNNSEEAKEKMTSTDTKDITQNDDKVSTSLSLPTTKNLVDVIPAAFEVKYVNGQTETWSKQLYQRSEGRTAGKLDIVILNPQGRKFRSRNEIMKYCEENGIIYSHEAFDFSAKGRPKSKSISQVTSLKPDTSSEEKEKFALKKVIKKLQQDLTSGVQEQGEIISPNQNDLLCPENPNSNKVFIGDYEVVIENGKFICPVKICGKHFRRENLLHMHMKHYHPEFSKYLDYTPSVTDLAYARTVGNLDAVEVPPPNPRKIGSVDKFEKVAIKAENVRKVIESPTESSKEAKKSKVSENKLEGKSNPVKISSETPTNTTIIDESLDENSQKNKFNAVGLQTKRYTVNEKENAAQENKGSAQEGASVEVAPATSERLTQNIQKISRHHRLHNRKKKGRFQSSIAEHLRKKRFIVQDRSRSQNTTRKQQQPQQLKQLPQTTPLQTPTSSHPPVDSDTNSNTLSQTHTMARYQKPHLNISNEISGKNNLLNNCNTFGPVSKKNFKNSRVKNELGSAENKSINLLKKGIPSKIFVENQRIKEGENNKEEKRIILPLSSRRSFLAALIKARKRKRTLIKKRLRKKEVKNNINLSILRNQEIDSGHKNCDEKPDEAKEKSHDLAFNSFKYIKPEQKLVNNNFEDKETCKEKLESCRTITENFSKHKKTIKLKIKRMNLNNQTLYNTSINENSFTKLSTFTEPDILSRHSAKDNELNRGDFGLNTEHIGEISETEYNTKKVKENAKSEFTSSLQNFKTKKKINAKNPPKSCPLLENICRKESCVKSANVTMNENDENIDHQFTSDSLEKLEKNEKIGLKSKKLNRRRQMARKKVRFEDKITEKWISVESKEFCTVTGAEIKIKDFLRREDRKKREIKTQIITNYLIGNETNLRKQSRDERSNLNNKTYSLDQTEVIEDSKSPFVIENDKVEKLRRNEIINCLCGITEEDGLMIQCDICLCWQHGHCAGILKELDVPDKYTCAICKNPYRARSSMKYLHDQEWLKEGTLPSLSFRSKRDEIISQRRTILKRSHDLSGSITLLAQVIHSLRIKVNIAEKKDHPKLWLWAKKWTEKKPNRLKEESDIKEEKPEEQSATLNNEVKLEGDSSLDDKQLPKAPEPEAPIDSSECRLNLLDHLIHYQTLVDARLSCIESLVAELESMQDDVVNDETPDRYPRTKATVQMILRDLNTMKKIATI